MNDVFKPAGQPNTTTKAPLLKLNQPLRRTNHGQIATFNFFLTHNHFSFL